MKVSSEKSRRDKLITLESDNANIKANPLLKEVIEEIEKRITDPREWEIEFQALPFVKTINNHTGLEHTPTTQWRKRSYFGNTYTVNGVVADAMFIWKLWTYFDNMIEIDKVTSAPVKKRHTTKPLVRWWEEEENYET